jgi:hypothetical protein
MPISASHIVVTDVGEKSSGVVEKIVDFPI